MKKKILSLFIIVSLVISSSISLYASDISGLQNEETNLLSETEENIVPKAQDNNDVEKNNIADDELTNVETTKNIDIQIEGANISFSEYDFSNMNDYEIGKQKLLIAGISEETIQSMSNEKIEGIADVSEMINIKEYFVEETIPSKTRNGEETSIMKEVSQEKYDQITPENAPQFSVKDFNSNGQINPSKSRVVKQQEVDVEG